MAPPPLALTNPGAQNSTVGVAITTLQLAATGGTPPHTYGATGLPPGLGINTSNGQITGTPTTEVGSPFAVNVTVTDSAAGPATDNKNFNWTVNAAPVGVDADRGHPGHRRQLADRRAGRADRGRGDRAYPTGGFNGFYIQTPGADTPNASDGIFVYGGAGGFATYPAIGDSVDVTGTVGEYFGKTEIASASWSPHGSSLGTVIAKTVVPGTDCPLPGTACDSIATLDAAREAAEGEAFQPAGTWTLTDVYDGGPFYGPGITNSSANHGELGVAAESTKPLIAPTELFDVQTQAHPGDRTRQAGTTPTGSSSTTGPATTYSTTAQHRHAVPVDDTHPRSEGRCGHHLPGPDDPDQGLLGVAAAPEQPGRGRSVRHPAAAPADAGGHRRSGERRR